MNNSGLTPDQIRMMQQIQRNTQRNQMNKQNQQNQPMASNPNVHNTQRNVFPNQSEPQFPPNIPLNGFNQIPPQWIHNQGRPKNNNNNLNDNIPNPPDLKDSQRFPSSWIPQGQTKNTGNDVNKAPVIPDFPEQWIPDGPPPPRRQSNSQQNQFPSRRAPTQFSINPNNYSISNASKTANTHTSPHITPPRLSQMYRQHIKTGKIVEQTVNPTNLSNAPKNNTTTQDFRNIHDILSKVENNVPTKVTTTVKNPEVRENNNRDTQGESSDKPRVFQGEFTLGSLQFPETSISLKSPFRIETNGIVQIDNIPQECVSFIFPTETLIKITINQSNVKRAVLEDVTIHYRFQEQISQQTESTSEPSIVQLLEKIEDQPSPTDEINSEVDLTGGKSTNFPTAKEVSDEVKCSVQNEVIVDSGSSSETETHDGDQDTNQRDQSTAA